jgi:hypothetical protein
MLIISYSAKAVYFPDRIVCADTVLTVDDGEKVQSECSLLHTFPSDAGWRIMWVRSDTGVRMSSVTADSVGFVKRVMTFTAEYPDSGGEYICSVISRLPAYLDSCTVRIHVRSKVLDFKD